MLGLVPVNEVAPAQWRQELVLSRALISVEKERADFWQRAALESQQSKKKPSSAPRKDYGSKEQTSEINRASAKYQERFTAVCSTLSLARLALSASCVR